MRVPNAPWSKKKPTTNCLLRVYGSNGDTLERNDRKIFLRAGDRARGLRSEPKKFSDGHLPLTTYGVIGGAGRKRKLSMRRAPGLEDIGYSFLKVVLRTYSALRVQYNNVLRAVLKKPRRCSASEMFAVARVDNFYAIIRKRAASMMSRLVSSTNTLLSTLAGWTALSGGAGMVCTRAIEGLS
ncbi:jg20366 [Pararge aegeria aegeria]|uniref:Jg20366 protein n=1 Tax=Pararge aegeria aegeria TaxID=348720 RepID=A0A8S4RDH8_9NEOP|nr:jg20366 [Pararge aegeria aegeria]